MAAHGDRRKPLMVTELSWTAAKGKTHITYGNEQTAKGQAKNLTAAYKMLARLRKRLRIERVYWYTWASYDKAYFFPFDWAGLIKVKARATRASRPSGPSRRSRSSSRAATRSAAARTGAQVENARADPRPRSSRCGARDRPGRRRRQAPEEGAANFMGVVADGPLFENPNVDFATELDTMVTNGVQTMRTVFNWSGTQPYATFNDVPADQRDRYRDENGVPTDYSKIDAVVAAAAERRIAVMPVVQIAPDWAARHPGELSSPPADPQQYAEFHRSARTPLRPGRLVLDRAPGARRAADPLLADLERAELQGVLVGPAVRGRLRRAAASRQAGDQGGGPGREDRARRPREQELDGARGRLQGGRRAAVRHRRVPPVHREGRRRQADPRRTTAR